MPGVVGGGEPSLEGHLGAPLRDHSTLASFLTQAGLACARG